MFLLPGPLPAGTYHVASSGAGDTTADAALHGELLFRHAGSPDVTLGTFDGVGTSFTDGGQPYPNFDADVTVAAHDVVAGDLLVLRSTMTVTSGDYFEYATHITLPVAY